ncbi:WG repeat-containing protein [Caldicellulosiruptor acetigenus]|uniref:KWG Leptospira repeat protein n=1 Tax=Caldicellulosiruptor acetigenus 6A TaxID=632516 RepID=G2PYF2_9FIRM|nr:WG repeat-containing protein [Caldicellulosiruptor acetigenus]AEM74002.1 KWG Leptospira repeat protein [Caldicellulosiruptor acetigenus 6A]
MRTKRFFIVFIVLMTVSSLIAVAAFYKNYTKRDKGTNISIENSFNKAKESQITRNNPKLNNKPDIQKFVLNADKSSLFPVFIRAGKDIKWGYVNIDGKFVIPAEYDEAYDFVSQSSVLIKDEVGMYYFLDQNSLIYEYEIYENNSNSNKQKDYYLAVVKKGDKYGVIDNKNNIILPFNFTEIYSIKDGKITATKDGNRYFVYDINGRIIKEGKDETAIRTFNVPERLKTVTYITYLGEDMFAVWQRNSNSSEDIENQSLADYLYEEGGDFYNTNKVGKCFAKKAIVNAKGEYVTSNKYYVVSNFKNGLCSVCDGQKTYLIDKQGKKITLKNISPVNGIGKIECVSENVYRVFVDNELYYVFPDGNFIYKCSDVVKVNDNLEIKGKVSRRSYVDIIYYPEVIIKNNKIVENRINSFIKKAFDIEEVKNTNYYDNGEDCWEDHTHFDFSLIGDILQIFKYTVSHQILAGTANTYNGCYWFDLKTGKRITIKDLFKKGTDVRRILAMQLYTNPNYDPEYVLSIISEKAIDNSEKFKLTDDKLILDFDTKYFEGTLYAEIPYINLLMCEDNINNSFDFVVDWESDIWKQLTKKLKYFKNGFVIPDSSYRKLTEEDLKFLFSAGKHITQIARNEIFARHGHIFDDSSWQEYFNGKRWYIPKKKIAFDDLNEVEKTNILLIRDRVEKEFLTGDEADPTELENSDE